MYTIEYEDEGKYKITLTRGDTFEVEVGVTKNGVAYKPVVGDELRFALKHNKFTNKDQYGTYEFTDEEPLLVKEIPIDTCILRLESEDTKPLGFGTYKYDIQLTYDGNRVDTFIENSPFILTPEAE